MTNHNRHVRRALRSWCAGLATLAVVGGLLASAGTASAAAPAAAPSSADCSGTAAAEPLVPFDTIAYSGTQKVAGVQVGQMFCPDPAAQAVQVVVLNSSNLHLLSNHGYSTSQFAELGSDLQALPTDSGDLVIVTHPGDQPDLPSDMLFQLDKSLSPIGGTVAADWTFGENPTARGCSSLYTNLCDSSGGTKWDRIPETMSGSSFTDIGIPGMTAGQAWRETAVQNNTPDGRITGYLQKGTLLTEGGPQRYTVVNGPDPFVQIDTCVDPADPGNLNDPSCAVKVGDRTYPPRNGVNGLHVVELDRTTLAPLADATVTTTGELANMLSSWPYPAVGHDVDSPFTVNDQRLVIIQSIGDGKLSGTLSNATLLAIDRLGGTVDYLADAVTKGCRYALIGAASNLPWHAASAESSTAMVKPGKPCSTPDQETPDQPTGHLYGVVQRNRDGLYTPSTTDAVGPTNADLYRIMYQPGTPWPFAGDPGLRYVADHLGLCDPAPAKCESPYVRSAYTNTLINFSSLQTPLGNLDCTEGVEVCGTDFTALKDELSNEFEWVGYVRNLVTDLKAPYIEGGSLGAFDVKKVTNQVLGSLPAVPTDHIATMKWVQVFIAVMSLASIVAGPISSAAGAVFGILGAGSTLATNLMQKPGGAPADSVTAAANNLGDELERQQSAYLMWVNNAGDILVSDYGRLSAVGMAIKKNPDWKWTGATTNDATIALQAGTRASAYSALLPIVWGGYNLQPGTANPPDANDVTKYTCAEWQVGYIHPKESVPFSHAVPDNQFHAVNSFNSSSGAALKEVWTFATNLTGFNTQNQFPAATVPSASLIDNIYGKNSTSQADGAFQYEASWWRSTFNPPRHVECNQNPLPTSPYPPLPYSTTWPAPKVTAPLP